jgi:menaquinone-dependent protoporphyrinogen oxidase
LDKRILVAYASRADSTREVAQYMGEVLREQDFEVDVLNINNVLDLRVYEGVVLGSAVRLGRLMPEVLSFAERFWHDLERRPTAYFAVCLTMINDTRESRAASIEYLRPLRDIHEPTAMGVFPGRMDRTRLNRGWHMLLNLTGVGEVADGDYRDWEAVRGWTQTLIPKLRSEIPRHL